MFLFRDFGPALASSEACHFYEEMKGPGLLEACPSKKAYMGLNYKMIAQSAEEVRNTENSPSVSMSRYLAETDQSRLLTVISIYGKRGESYDQVRLLYMNDEAFRIWREMKRPATILGEMHRPPRDAVLTFGVPFSE